jgi:hypothetical protein
VAVGLEPLPACLARLLPVLVPWLVVVRLGRVLCLLAQRVPPVVAAVQAVQRRCARRPPS